MTEDFPFSGSCDDVDTLDCPHCKETWPVDDMVSSFGDELLCPSCAERCGCTARAPYPTDIDPPEVQRNRRCEIHGDTRHTDPDRARDEEQDREWLP